MWPFRSKGPAARQMQADDAARCRVCRTALGDADALRVHDRWPICPACVDAVGSLVEGSTGRSDSPVWLDQAADDLDAARASLAQGRFHLAFFLCHEAIEKAVRAFLVSQGKQFGRTHSIFWLAREAAKLDGRFAEIGSDAWTLDTLYVFSRYPFGSPARAPREFFSDDKDAGEAIDVAGEVLELARRVLSDAQPNSAGPADAAKAPRG